MIWYGIQISSIKIWYVYAINGMGKMALIAMIWYYVYVQWFYSLIDKFWYF